MDHLILCTWEIVLYLEEFTQQVYNLVGKTEQNNGRLSVNMADKYIKL